MSEFVFGSDRIIVRSFDRPAKWARLIMESLVRLKVIFSFDPPLLYET